MDISVHALQEAVSIRRQIDTLQKRLSSILGGSPTARATRKGRGMSAATRAKLAAAAKARWARIKAGQKTTAKGFGAKKKGGITPAGRKRLSQLMKARWAARRKSGGR